MTFRPPIEYTKWEGESPMGQEGNRMSHIVYRIQRCIRSHRPPTEDIDKTDWFPRLCTNPCPGSFETEELSPSRASEYPWERPVFL